jgi:hypothetical protein
MGNLCKACYKKQNKQESKSKITIAWLEYEIEEMANILASEYMRDCLSHTPDLYLAHNEI